MILRIINLTAIPQNALLARKNRGNTSPYHLFFSKTGVPEQVLYEEPTRERSFFRDEKTESTL